MLNFEGKRGNAACLYFCAKFGQLQAPSATAQKFNSGLPCP
jgi:hypothetical protein